MQADSKEALHDIKNQGQQRNETQQGRLVHSVR